MNSALSNLTEAYTDSENEDNHEDVAHSDPEEMQIKAEIIVQPKKNSKHMRRLVSYNDGDNEHHEDEISDEEEDEPVDESKDEANSEPADSEDKYATFAKKYGFELPPEPKSKPDPKLQDIVSNILQKSKRNPDFDLNKYILARKDFRNPSIYDKLIQFCELNELGTNFPPEIFDVSIYGPESFYEELTKAQKFEMDKLEKMKKENSSTKVEVIFAEAIKRKSKWDQQAPSSAGNSASTATVPKPTVISAFGTLKKPKI